MLMVTQKLHLHVSGSADGLTVIGTQIKVNEPVDEESNRNNRAHATGAVVVDSAGG